MRVIVKLTLLHHELLIIVKTVGKRYVSALKLKKKQSLRKIYFCDRLLNTKYSFRNDLKLFP